MTNTKSHASIRRQRTRLTLGTVYFQGRSYDLLSARGAAYLFSPRELEKAENRANRAIKKKVIKKPKKR